MLDQPVDITFGVPHLALRWMSARTVRCPDCPHRWIAPYEFGSPAGLLDVEAEQARLIAHAHQSPAPHPTILGVPAQARRSA